MHSVGTNTEMNTPSKNNCQTVKMKHRKTKPSSPIKELEAEFEAENWLTIRKKPLKILLVVPKIKKIAL